jgi:hypothetical protein
MKSDRSAQKAICGERGPGTNKGSTFVKHHAIPPESGQIQKKEGKCQKLPFPRNKHKNHINLVVYGKAKTRGIF